MTTLLVEEEEPEDVVAVDLLLRVAASQIVRSDCLGRLISIALTFAAILDDMLATPLESITQSARGEGG
jgi:hypothetical protein